MKKVKSKFLGIMTVVMLTAGLLALMLSVMNVGTTFAKSSHSLSAKEFASNKSDLGVASKSQNDVATYIVVLQDEPLVAYTGDIAGLVATNPQVVGDRKLDVDSAASVAYLNYLSQKRNEALTEISSALGRNVEAIYEYKAALHGFAVSLTAAEANIVANLPEVKFVEREIQYQLETDAGPSWIEAPAIWNGTQTNRDFSATIDEGQEVPPTGSSATGTGSFTYDFETNELTWDISHTGLANVTAAHIHSATVGTNGGVEIALDHTMNPMVGSAVLSADQEWALVNGYFYVNIHTTGFPGGEIRGQIWQAGNMGEGIVVGIIDTGIDPWNPSFADVGGDSYDHTNPWGSGNYVGVCNPGDPTYDPTFACNDKLVGAWGYSGVNGGDPRDSDGHGSHTSSTAAGNFVDDTYITTTTKVFSASISGVAPHANVVMYAACCAGSALAAARDQAVIDGVDVVNYSIGANVPTANPWSDAESQQWLNMRTAGIFVATSAGNNGPNDATLFRPGDIPWITAVAASSHNRTFLNSLTVSDGVTGSITVNGESMTGPLLTPAEVVLSSWYTLGGTIDPEDARLCGSSSGNPFPPGTFSGEIVVCERGIYGRVEKGENVAAAGAGGYILAQPTEFGGGPGSLASDPHVLPAIHINYYEYQDLLNYMANASGTVSGTIAGSILDVDDAHGDILASFSSRGPNSAPLLSDILKPQISAPGRAIWAAYNQGAGGDGDYTYNVIQGTSMASPHAAGAGALLMAAHPDWTPTMIESAMATTADTTVFNDDGINPATPFGMGSGRIDLSLATEAGLVLEVTTAEFQAANPNTGGDPKDLNLSSLADSECLNICSWTRTVSSTMDVPVTWTASVQVPAGMTLDVSPSSFVLPAHGTQEIVVTADVSGLTIGEWTFAEFSLTPSVGSVPEAHFPVAVIQAGGPPSIEIPDSVESTQGLDVTVVKPFTITNNGDGDLNWSIFEDDAAMRENGGWSDDFDSYPTGQDLHGVGGWEGWANSPAATAFTSDTEARSTPNSVDINGGSDLIHPYSQTTGIWTYTAWQYIPSSFLGTSYFIMLNQYDDACSTCNWSVEVQFDSATGLMVDDGSGLTMPFVTDAWAKIEVVIDLDSDLQTFLYNDAVFYSGTWNGYVSGPGSGSNAIAVVDLYANGASPVYYDDMSLAAGPPVLPSCQIPTDIPWLSVSPTSGTTAPDANSIVDVTFDSTGLSAGVYTGTLCVSSDDPINPLVSAPVTMTVLSQAPPDIVVDPGSLTASQPADVTTTQSLDISNVGEADLDWAIDEAGPLEPISLVPSTVVDNTDLTALTSMVEVAGLTLPRAVQGGATILWEQPYNNSGSGIVSDYSTTQMGGAYSASDFVLTSTAEITLIFADGFDNANTLSTEPAIDWAIYPDAAGIPAGNPETNPGAAVWWYSSATTGPGVDITDNKITLDLVAAGQSLSLGAGTYWLTVFPTYDNNITAANDPRWNWYSADQVGAQSHLIAPVLFGGLPNWTPFGSIGLPFFDTAFRLEGNYASVPEPCDVANDIPWLTVSPTAGTTISGTSSTVDVTFDSTGMATGSYTGTLCINSNDPDTPLVQVPLTLTVVPTVYDVDIAPDAAMSATVGTTVTYTLEVMNMGNAPDTFDLSVAGNTWMTMLSDSTVSLDAGESATVMVMVHIPEDATDGEMDTATVTATSQGDGAVTDSATLTTTAVVPEPTVFYLYLPFVVKD